MKNVGSLLAFAAFSATFVSGRAVHGPNALAARVPFSEVAEIYSREPKKNKAAKANGTATAATVRYIDISS